jgi:hypothetical protein
LGQGNATYRKDRGWFGVDANGFHEDGIARTPGLPDLQIPQNYRSLLGVRAGAPAAEGLDVLVRARWLRWLVVLRGARPRKCRRSRIAVSATAPRSRPCTRCAMRN